MKKYPSHLVEFHPIKCGRGAAACGEFLLCMRNQWFSASNDQSILLPDSVGSICGYIWTRLIMIGFAPTACMQLRPPNLFS